MPEELIAFWVTSGGVILLLLWVFNFFAGIAIAESRGRWSFGTGLGLLIFGPVMTVILAAMWPNESKLREMAEDEMADSKDWKECPLCDELVRIKALRCRHCGFLFEPYRAVKIVEAAHTADQGIVDKENRRLQAVADREEEEQLKVIREKAVRERDADRVSRVENRLRGKGL